MEDPSLEARIVERLEEAERDLLAIVSEAARTADYTAIDAARTAASALHRLREGLHVVDGRPVDAPQQRANVEDAKSSRRGRAKPRPVKSGYPKFYIRDDSLIKEGWSKKSSKTYTHRVPADAFRQAIGALKKAGGDDGRPLTTDVLLGESNLEGNNSLPTYQFYVVLAFLKANGVIRQVGRNGYVIPSDLEKKALEIWKQQASAKRGN